MRENLENQQLEKQGIKGNENEKDREIANKIRDANLEAIEAEKKKKNDYRSKLQQINNERFAQSKAQAEQKEREKMRMTEYVKKLKMDHQKIEDYETEKKVDFFHENKKNASFNLNKLAN